MSFSSFRNIVAGLLIAATPLASVSLTTTQALAWGNGYGETPAGGDWGGYGGDKGKGSQSGGWTKGGNERPNCRGHRCGTDQSGGYGGGQGNRGGYWGDEGRHRGADEGRCRGYNCGEGNGGGRQRWPGGYGQDSGHQRGPGGYGEGGGRQRWPTANGGGWSSNASVGYGGMNAGW